MIASNTSLLGLAREVMTDSSDDELQVVRFGIESPSLSAGTALPLSSFGTRRSKGVGTETYAAPEQREGKDYDEKCDIYSLGMSWLISFCIEIKTGLILFELGMRFQTEMERAMYFQQVRGGKISVSRENSPLFMPGVIPEDFLHQYPLQVIRVLLRHLFHFSTELYHSSNDG